MPTKEQYLDVHRGATVMREMERYRTLADGAPKFTVEVLSDGTPLVTPERRSAQRAPTRNAATRTRDRRNVPIVDRDQLLKQDAREMHKLHDGDYRKVAGDRRLFLDEFNLVSDHRILFERKKKLRPGDKIYGMTKRTGKWHDVLISDSCPTEEIIPTIIHEFGHVRSYQLLGESTERDAWTWADEWWAAEAKRWR